MKKLLALFALIALAGTVNAQTLSANGSLSAAVMLTGETVEFTGNCTSSSGINNVDIRIQNGTGTVWTNSTTSQTADVYVNVTNYITSALNGESANFTFLVNATKPGIYQFRAQCESDDATTPEQANSSDAPSALTVNQAFGNLIIVLYAPMPGATTNAAQNGTFTILTNATCLSDNPTATCDDVNITALYNRSSQPDTQINTTTGDSPFWTSTLNNTCGMLNVSNVCNASWLINATGSIGSTWLVGAIAQSNNTIVVQNTTQNATVSITECLVDFSLHWNAISFGSLIPSTTANAAPGNDDNLYNTSVNSGSCNVDFYISGTDLTNSSIPDKIDAGYVKWNNDTDSYATSFNLSSLLVSILMDVAPVANITTWYWLNVPPVPATFYNGTIFITGVKSGDAP